MAPDGGEPDGPDPGRADPGRADPDGPGPDGHRLVVRQLPPDAVARHARALLREIFAEAGAGEEQTADAELAVSELAANADNHATGPYELRVLTEDGLPIWCAIVDGDPDPGAIPVILERLRRIDACAEKGEPDDGAEPDDEPPAESGHGLLIVHRLSDGRCRVFPAISGRTGTPAKAVGFGIGPPPVRR